MTKMIIFYKLELFNTLMVYSRLYMQCYISRIIVILIYYTSMYHIVTVLSNAKEKKLMCFNSILYFKYITYISVFFPYKISSYPLTTTFEVQLIKKTKHSTLLVYTYVSKWHYQTWDFNLGFLLWWPLRNISTCSHVEILYAYTRGSFFIVQKPQSHFLLWLVETGIMKCRHNRLFSIGRHSHECQTV